MIYSTTLFSYAGRTSSSFSPIVINATLSNDLYEFAPLGSKSIVEDKIQGRDVPYFYNVDYEPLEFNMTIAFTNYATQSVYREVIKWLYNQKTPQLLYFPELGLNFFGLFIGQPNIYYVGNNNEGYNQYIGHIEVSFRANAPHGWTNIMTNLTDTDPVVIDQSTTFPYTLSNIGDYEMFPSFKLQNTSGAANEITISTQRLVSEDPDIYENVTTFTYNFVNDEYIVFNGYSKNIKSYKISDDTTQQINPYNSWEKDYWVLEPGNNYVKIVSEGNFEFEYSFRAPKIL